VKQLRWWMGALSSALVWTACIKREPVVKDVTAAAATGGDGAEGSPEAGQGQATGKYGKVPGIELLGGSGIEAFSLQGATARVVTSTVDVSGQPFAKATRAQIKEKSPNLWDVQLQATSKSEVRRGDVLLVSTRR
jgi:hypothetical protein